MSAARWLLLVLTAWGLRIGGTPAEMGGLLARALPHRDSTWRQELLDAAVARNARKAGRDA